jgi:sugar/nucleoside kinase (ribokinase family)
MRPFLMPIFDLDYNHAMPGPQALEPIDYLMIGHITADLTPNGTMLGGTVAYSALTAEALGFRVGMVTAMGKNVRTDRLEGIPFAGVSVDRCTTFENKATPDGRVQVIHHHAPILTPAMVPTQWRETPLVHIGPIAHEIGPGLIDLFEQTTLGLTPQGYLRQWDALGRITPRLWPQLETALALVDIVILSIQDLDGDAPKIEALIDSSDIVVITDGCHGSTVYTDGIQRHFEAPEMNELDSVGAGDIFAAAYFCHYSRHKDPFQAAAFATHLAAFSVQRVGLDGVPSQKELDRSLHVVETTLQLNS